MHSFRLSLLAVATVFSAAAPMAASACGMHGENMGASFMSTPVSMRGQFIFATRMSRRALRHAVTERETQRALAPLVREIL